MARFTGKVVLVTGSSNGIGRATARLFARDGAAGITVTGRSLEALEAAKHEVQGENPNTKVLALIGDITNRDFQKELIDRTLNTFGKLDILINNAGAASKGSEHALKGPGLEKPLDYFDYIFELNTKTPLALVQLAIPHLEKTKGEIVNISSIGGLHFAMPSGEYYGAAKAALDHLTRSMAVAYIPRGIRVNGINPGSVKTEFSTRIGLPPDQKDDWYKNRDSNRHNVPIGRSGTPEDIAKAIAFLADREQSEFIIGVKFVSSLKLNSSASLLMAVQP